MNQNQNQKANPQSPTVETVKPAAPSIEVSDLEPEQDVIGGERAARTGCQNNLKQIGLA